MAAATRYLWLAPWVLVLGCNGGDSTDPDVPGDTTDVVDAADADAADTTADGTADGAPRPCPTDPDPAIPVTRMRHLSLTEPVAMNNAVVNGLLNSLLDAESFVWLTRFTGVGSGAVAVLTGSGHKVPDTECDYALLAAEYPPAEFEVTETGLEFALEGDPVPMIEVALWASGTAWPGEPLTVLPMREMRISGAFEPGRLSIGRYDDAAETWIDGATLDAKITVADAIVTPMPSLGMSLCGLMSGDIQAPGDMTDDCTGPRPWTHEPDTTVDGEEAYTMTGTFAGTAVNLVE